MLEKNFDSAKIESTIYEQWEQAQAFKCDPTSQKPPFCIMMPPPNVTGTLHMGHALNYTLQDIPARYKRMRGYDVLWQPGTDHAGIATQVVVEKQLLAHGLKRQDLGRETFLKHVWEWKEKSGNIIVEQQRRLGLSPDWSRQRFTMDEGLSKAVSKVFVELYRQGLIYRDKRLVNWDPKLLTAVSDVEVKSIETPGYYWYFNYPLVNDPHKFITIATSRPETLFGDTAVAVNPDDERYQHLIGQYVTLPFMNRQIPIIADTYSNPEKGSGAVKITPAHDFNDFEVGKRHNLERIVILTADGRMNDNVPQRFQGLDRFEARQRVIDDMHALGLLKKVEDATLMVPHGERTHAIIEPYLTDQWFVKTDEMAAEALQAVKDSRTVLLPQSDHAVYNHWLNTIQPWCISRQLWWGHRIPVWYTQDGAIVVAETSAEAQRLAKEQYGQNVILTQDEDVLDTWFSSALWPFSTLGWPEITPELQRYYPSDVLITGHDILFFWVVRMMLFGLKFMDQVPFKTVYFHALVRDDKGQKMSKSKGNIIDPLDLINIYGADALRFTMAALAAPGRDINFSHSVVEGYRNFITKLWNAARFAEYHHCRYDESFNPDTVTHTINRWIIAEMAQLVQQVTAHFETFNYDNAASLLYQFTWTRFCDWYLEFSKSILNDDHDECKLETQRTIAWILNTLCHLLHPIIPFVTEKLWSYINQTSSSLLCQSHWPVSHEFNDNEAVQEIAWIIDLVTAVRSLRHDLDLLPTVPLTLIWGEGDDVYKSYLRNHQNRLAKMAMIKGIDTENKDIRDDTAAVKNYAQIVVQGVLLVIPLNNVLDIAVEQQRLQKGIDECLKEIKQVETKLGNADFIAKAPVDIIVKNEQRLQNAQSKCEKLKLALQRINN